MTNHRHSSVESAAPPTRTSNLSDRKSRLRVLSHLFRGVLLGGAACLLGACPLFFGTAPLGLALLAAASSYTWYILGGLLLSAALFPVSLSGWTWSGVYILCIILRLAIRFFVDPPTLPDGRPCRGRTYLRLCWISFQRNVGLMPGEESEPDADYYPGVGSSPSPPRSEGAPPPSEFHPRLFWEHPFLRMMTAAVCGLTAGIFGLIIGGFHMYDLFAALILLILTPIVTFLLVSCFGEAGMTLLFAPDPLGTASGQARRESLRSGVAVVQHFHALPLCSVCFFLGCLVFAARGFSPMLGSPYLTISLSTLLGLILTLAATTRLGVIPGLTVGVICGMAASPAISPLFILCAGGCGFLSVFSHRMGVIGGCLVGGLWCLSVEGVGVLLPLLPAILLTPPTFLLTQRLWASLPAPESKQESDADLRDMADLLTSALSLEARDHSRRMRMQALADAFDSLSKRFYSLSSQLKRPRMLDLRRICDESFGKQCARCRNRDLCWGAEYDRTLEVQARLAAQLHGSGKANAAALPDTLQDFCPHLETLIADINGRCARMTENLLRSEKTEVFAADYAAIATLLTDALEEEQREARDFTCNREAADTIYDYLTEIGITVQGVVVGGKQSSRRQRVIIRGVGFQNSHATVEEIRKRLESICGCKLTSPVFEEEENGTVMTLCSEARITTAYSGSTVPAGQRGDESLPPPLTPDTPLGEYHPPEICGDHIAMFKTDNAYFYALISDGMGAGENASLTSDICAMFLEKMLMAGNKVDISLRMLDTYIHSKNTGTGDECSATVDLMELDLMDGQAVFAKNGAAPTYVVREGKVYKLRAPTMPIGILSDTPRELLRFRTHPGDVVVMVSDGITLGNDECPWLMDLLASPMPMSMDSLRMDIIRRALSAGSEDDLSAIAIRVEEQ